MDGDDAAGVRRHRQAEARQAKRLLVGRVGVAVGQILAGDLRSLGHQTGGHGDGGCGRRVVVVQERIDERLGQLAGLVGVHRDEDAEPLGGDQEEVGVEPLGIAAVADDPEAVAGLLVEA